MSKSSENIVTEPVRHILLRGGATAEERSAQRIPPKRMKEILSSYFKAEGVQVFTGEKMLVEALQSKGLSLAAAKKEFEAKGFSNVGGRTYKNFPTIEGPGVFIAGKEQLNNLSLKIKGETLKDPNRVQLNVAAHEGIERYLQKIVNDPSQKVASHHSPQIYAAEMEMAANLDYKSVELRSLRQQKELPGVIKQIEKWTDPAKKAAGLKEISNLPDAYHNILNRRGYKKSEIESVISPIKSITKSINLTASGKTSARATGKDAILSSPFSKAFIPKTQVATKQSVPKIKANQPTSVESFIKNIKPPMPEIKETSKVYGGLYKFLNKNVIDVDSSKIKEGKIKSNRISPFEHTNSLIRNSKIQTELDFFGIVKGSEFQKTEKNASAVAEIKKQKTTSKQTKNTIKQTTSKANTKVAQGVKELDRLPVLEDYITKSTKKLDDFVNLATLKRAAPYAAAVAAGANLLASRDKTGPFWGAVGGLGALLLAKRKGLSHTKTAISTLAGYTAGHLAGSTISSLHDPDIEGLSEAGEASIGRKQLTEFGSGWRGLKSTVNVLGKTLNKSIKKGFKTFVGGAPKVDEEIGLIESWVEIIGEAKKRGVAQDILMEDWRQKGIFEKNLPAIPREEFDYRGIQRKSNPLMEFSKDEVQNALQQYAKEKGITGYQSYFDTAKSVTKSPIKVLNTAQTSSVSISLGGDPKIGVLPTLAAESQQLALAKTLPANNPAKDNLSAVKRLALAETQLGTSQSEIRQLELAQTLSASDKAKSLDQFGPTLWNNPNNLHSTINPLGATQVDAAKRKTHIGSAATLSAEQINKSIDEYARTALDVFNSTTDQSLVRRSHPQHIEGFKDIGMAETLRLTNTDFGTGWDPARRLAKLLFSKQSQKGITELSDSQVFQKLLENTEFQEALSKGKVIKKLGEGGIGSVEQLETTFRGEKFTYARKQYHQAGVSSAEELLEGEMGALRVIQDTIGPTPYGRGEIAQQGQKLPVMYFEAIEDAISGSKAVKQQGGLTTRQAADLTDAITQLHQKGFVHGDLKFQNTLIDNQGRMVLIDPFPNRFKAAGWDNIASAEEINRIQKTQDLVGLDRILAGGDVSRMIDEAGEISNALALVTLPRSQVEHQYGVGTYDSLSSFAAQILKQSKSENVARNLRFDLNNVFPPRDIMPGPPPPSEKMAAMRRRLNAQADQIQKRQQVHAQAMQTMQQNNQSPARRHGQMNQTQNAVPVPPQPKSQSLQNMLKGLAGVNPYEKL